MTGNMQRPWSNLRTTSSQSIGLPLLIELLSEVSQEAPTAAYEHAVVVGNLFDKDTVAGRHRVFRHLRELYLLDPDRAEFRALRSLAEADPAATPLLGGLLAFTRDELFRTSHEVIAKAIPGDRVDPRSLAEAIGWNVWAPPSDSTLAKAGRNIAASWTQTGHLRRASAKTRVRIDPPAGALAYAVVLGRLDRRSGSELLNTRWTAFLDLDPDAAARLAQTAHRAGLLTVPFLSP